MGGMRSSPAVTSCRPWASPCRSKGLCPHQLRTERWILLLCKTHPVSDFTKLLTSRVMEG